MIEKETFARQHESGGWEDEFGMIGPFKQGVGPRSNPRNKFPTGPNIGQRLPDISAPSHTGEIVNVHKSGSNRPAVVVIYRSAVW